MLVLNIDDASQQALLALPETGMGFQLVEAAVLGQSRTFLVFNAERAIDLSDVDLVVGDDPMTVLKNGALIVGLLKTVPHSTAFVAPPPTSFRLLSSRIPTGQAAATSGGVPSATLPSSLVKSVALPVDRPFHRFSAFHPDRRVDPLTGSFLAGTYACPASEVPFVPTGFAAVGRFALPNSLPASHHYEILAPAGSNVVFGTVAPAFSQAGGGVEAYFSQAVTNAAIPPTTHNDLDDE